MSEAREVQVETFQKSSPKKYFNLSMTIMLFTGMYPLSSERSFIVRILFSTYALFMYLFLVILNPISKGIALLYQTNLDDITDNLSFLINHAMAAFKIAIFIIKRNNLMTLVETIESKKFRHTDCSQNFSANRLICRAVKITQGAYCVFSSFVVGLIGNSILGVTIGISHQDVRDLNSTESAESIGQEKHRSLPFHSWYPFSTQISPNYEIVFIYQIFALFWTSQMVMALDTLVVGFMIHIKVQFQILSHNLLFITSHAKNNKSKNHSASTDSVSQTVCNESELSLTQIMETDLERHIAHHQAIIQLSEDLESVFTYQILLQFVCSLIATCMLLWQVSSTPVLSAKFASMLSYLGATAFQLFIYCWFGNEMMLESLSVADAAWGSGWKEIASPSFSHGMVMIIQRSQRVIMITAGRFVGLTLDTFMSVSRADFVYLQIFKMFIAFKSTPRHSEEGVTKELPSETNTSYELLIPVLLY